METTFRIKPEELDERLLASIKAPFPYRTIEIRVSDVFNDDDDDETSYLMRSPANHAVLMQRLENIKNGENLVTVDIDDIMNVEKLQRALGEKRNI